MRIKSSGQLHTLYRYGGQVDGKTIEVKIGAVAAGTRPDAISVDLRDDLTQKELRELVEHLDREQLDISRTRLSALVVDLDTAAGLIGSQNLDAEAAEKLADSLSRTTAAVRRVQREHRASAPPVDPPVNQTG
jgi:hypothetical protein